MSHTIFQPITPLQWKDLGWSNLVHSAASVREHAYVPHSEFAVGAAVLSGRGDCFVGCNMENAAFPQGLCAEATAIGAMVSSGQRHIVRVVVVAGKSLVTPCGGCRQKIAEFARPTTEILMVTSDLSAGWLASFEDLFPGAFSAQDML